MFDTKLAVIVLAVAVNLFVAPEARAAAPVREPTVGTQSESFEVIEPCTGQPATLTIYPEVEGFPLRVTPSGNVVGKEYDYGTMTFVFQDGTTITGTYAGHGTFTSTHNGLFVGTFIEQRDQTRPDGTTEQMNMTFHITIGADGVPVAFVLNQVCH